jgi:galactan endo-1,6-beta-galactosidase
MAQKAVARGANKIELFSNSPVWWMCGNHNPSGSASGGDNLETWNQQKHAIYLATVAKYAKDNWGINFSSVEPFNEPVSTWWKDTGTQEGCHFDNATQQPVVNYLRAELNNRGLSGVPISASDDNTYDEAVTTWNSFNSTVKGNVGQINVHGYQGQNGSRDGLYKLASAAGKTLWNSEYGDSDGTGLTLASNLILDFRWLHPTAWVYWQVIDGGGWGLIQETNAALSSVNQKYFVVAQFVRHIRPGMLLIDGGNSNTVAAYDATNHKLVIVAANYGTAQNLTFDLSKFSTIPASGTTIDRWSTNTAGGDSYAHYTDVKISGKSVTAAFTANTIQTFEISGVYL